MEFSCVDNPCTYSQTNNKIRISNISSTNIFHGIVPYYFHGMLFWILNKKENKEAFAIFFEVKIPRKKQRFYGIIPSKIAQSDVRQKPTRAHYDFKTEPQLSLAKSDQKLLRFTSTLLNCFVLVN